MKKIGMMFACLLLAACGSSKSGSRAPTTPEPEVATATEAETSTYDESAMAPEETFPEDELDEPIPGPADTTLAGRGTQVGSEPAAAGDMIATAEITSVKDGSAMGTVTFERGDDGAVLITGEFSGLKKKGVHAFYVHQNGDCSNKGKKVGAHLDPTKAKHGPPASSERHAGDFGNLTADEAGNATFSMTTDSITLEGDRPDSVLDRSIVVYAGKDNKSGKPGAVLACGVIRQSDR